MRLSSGAATVLATSGRINEKGTGMAIGTVKWFNAKEGYGCIAADDGEGELFTQCPADVSDVASLLIKGQRVRFEVTQDSYGPIASNIEVI